MNTHKELEALFKQFTVTTEIAERDLSGWDRNTREGQEMAKRSANANLPHIRHKYSEALNASTKYILVHGTDDEFSIFLNQLESVKSQFFVNSTLSLYEYLCPRVEQNLSTSREFNIHSLLTLQGEMVTLGKILDKNYVLEPKLDVVKVPKTHDDLVLVIRDAVMANSEYALMFDYLNMVYTDQALKAKNVAPESVFVLRCLNEKEAEDLRTFRSTTIDLSASNDYLPQLKEFLEIKDSAKKSKAAKTKEQ